MFPVDMLRYDQAFPADHVSVENIGNEDRKKRVVTLAAYHPRYWTPTIGRWESFSWNVISHKK